MSVEGRTRKRGERVLDNSKRTVKWGQNQGGQLVEMHVGEGGGEGSAKQEGKKRGGHGCAIVFAAWQSYYYTQRGQEKRISSPLLLMAR